MAKPITQDFIGLALSAEEVAQLTDWPEPMVSAFVSLVEDISTTANSVDANYMKVGVGSPEGAITANKSRQYFDSNAGTLYINPVVGEDSGWISI